MGLLLLLPLTAIAADSTALESIDSNRLPGDRVQIVMKFTGAAPTPLSFTIANPARIALDFPDTRNSLAQRVHQIKVGAAQSVSTAQANDRTRVVINLSEMMAYQTEIRGDRLLVTLAPSSAPQVLLTRETQLPAAATPAADTFPTSVEGISDYMAATAANNPDSIEAIDFRRSSDGAGRILIKLSNPSTPIDINQQGTHVIVNLKRTELPAEMQRRMDVLDFATPVETIDAKTIGDNTQITINAKGKFSQLAYQSGNTYTVEIRPIAEKKLHAKKKEISFKGERLSLNFQDIEVRSVLQLIADFTGLNIVVSDDVSGNVTLRLKNVPWDQALDIIMKTKALDKRQHGNVVYIDTAKNIAAHEEEVLNHQKTQQKLTPLRSEIISLNYADAEEMKQLLQSSGGGGGAGGGTSNSIMSQRGSVSIDRRTNNLLLQDTPAKLEEIRALIKTLDVPVRQVMIESRIVTASDKFTKELGASFSAGNTTQDLDQILTTGFAVNLPAAGGSTIGLALAKIPLGAQLDLELSAAKTESRVEIVASPRIITSNKTTARIEQGVEIPYEEATSSGATNISFKKAVLSLEVTPHITRDDRINMELAVNRDSVGQLFNNIPSIDTREVQTQVLVENGQTIVLGGIFEENKVRGDSRVPFFGDLPILGRLFRNESSQDNKSELLIFVTPKIINDDLSLH